MPLTAASRLCCVGYTFRRFPLAHALSEAARSGYGWMELRDAIDCDWHSAAGIDEALARSAALAGGLGLRVYAVFAGWLVQGDQVHPEAAQVLESLSRHGVPVLHTRAGSPPDRPHTSRDASEEDFARVARGLSTLGAMAASVGVQVAVETHMGTIHDTAASHARLLDRVESPAVGASLDFANMRIENPEEDLEDAIARFSGRTFYVHLKNIRHSPTGFDWDIPIERGIIDYAAVLQALHPHYAGPLGVEYCGEEEPAPIALRDAAYLSEVLSRLG